ncbi:MAG: DUF5668 domain-containing protein [bacterium]|nr:DUF5668 domain-containing protein [bacterium]
MKSKKTSPIPGLLLVLTGFWLLLHQTDWVPAISESALPVFLISVAVLLLIDAIRRSGSSSLFWGVFLFQVGIFFLLRNHGIIARIDADEYWPVFLFAFGLSFYLLFLIHPGHRGLLIPSGLLLYAGLAAASESLMDAPAGLDAAIRYFGPVFFVLSGIWMLLRLIAGSFRKTG